MMAKAMTIISIAVTMTVALTSCQQDKPAGKDKSIGMKVVCTTTRAAATTTPMLQAAGSFNVMALEDGTSTPYFDNIITATYVNDAEDPYWATGQDWPDADKTLCFWSFAPADEIVPTFGSGTMSFEYPPANDLSARKDAVNQKDVLVAYTGGRTANNAGGKTRVPVTFNHAMSAIEFKLGTIDSWYREQGIEYLQISSIILKDFAANGICTITSEADLDARDNKAGKTETTGNTIEGSNMSISWAPYYDNKTDYQNFFDVKIPLSEAAEESYHPYLHQLPNIDGKTDNGQGIFMIVPQTLEDASLSLNWGVWEKVANTLGGEPELQFVQRPTRTTPLQDITFEAGYKYVFTININHKVDPDNPDLDESDIYVILTEKVPWDYVPEIKEYADIASGYPKIEFDNVASWNPDSRQVFVYPYPEALECSVRLASPKGAKLLIKIEQEFDAFDYEFITSDQIPEEGNQDNVEPIRFKLIPRYRNPEREYVATLSLSLRLVNGRIVNIDNQVQKADDSNEADKYKIVLQKAN